MTDDNVNHPKHYTKDPSGIECIEIAELLPFCLGNCYKYLHRAGLKDDKIQDYQKALWYAKRSYLNAESLNRKARSRIHWVAKFQTDPLKKRILLRFATSSLVTFMGCLEAELSQLTKHDKHQHTDLDNSTA